MREIKFRAWDKKSKKYRKLDFMSFGGKGCFDTCDQLPKVYGLWGRDIIDNKPMVCHRERMEVELEQFTGLHDNNGKEIYEGDVVKGRFDRIGLILFDNGGFGIKKINGYVEKPYEVIGNIHENPELLKG